MTGSGWTKTSLACAGAAAVWVGIAHAQSSPGSVVRPWTAADTAASRANPRVPATPMPPRPAGYPSLSDEQLYRKLSARLTVGTPQEMQAAAAALTPQEKAWMRAFTRRATSRYIADRDAGRVTAQRSVVAAPTNVQPMPVPAVASRLTRYEAGVVSEALHALKHKGTVPQTYGCESLRNFYVRMAPADQVETDRLCPTAEEMNRARTLAYERAQAEAAREYAAEGARARASGPLPVAGDPLVRARTYDARTGTYRGTEVMTKTEAELRGAKPR